jgi:diacylglycerol kinase family enzyme
MEFDLPIFMNPAAGAQDDSQHEAMQNAFRSAGARTYIHIVRGPELVAAIREAIQAGAQIVGVAGGDGTISTAANALVQTQAAMLPIPLGTRNHFAARYGISDLDAAAQGWRQKTIRQVHVGTVNDRIFVNNASCGFYPKAVRYRERLERFMPRAPALWIAGMSVLVELPLLHVQIAVGHEVRHLRTPALWVGIGRHSLKLPASGDAVGAEPLLEAISGRTDTRRAVVRVAFRLFRHLKRGMQLRDDRLDVVHTREFTLAARKVIDVALDGEPFRMQPPLDFAIRENALRVVGPVRGH